MTSVVQGIRWEVSEHCGQWEIGDRRKAEDKHFICFSCGQFRGTLFQCIVSVDILQGCVIGCVFS